MAVEDSALEAGPREGSVRRALALKLIREEPGITIPQLAERMDVKQNYLYRLLPILESEGRLVKMEGEGSDHKPGWHVPDAIEDPAEDCFLQVADECWPGKQRGMKNSHFSQE